MTKDLFYKQADLLISILPYMTKDTDFAIHGGTAINFFVREIPRISVDIDLTYLPISSREEALAIISKRLKMISKHITSNMPSIKVEEKIEKDAKGVTKLLVKKENAIVKVEPNQVIRGSLFDCEERNLCKKAEDLFEKFTIVKTLSFAELYGSKICAALDRQHPRDIFDIMLLQKNEGITEEIRKAFLVYLISHNRPIHELLAPNFKNIKPVFEKEFSGMASIKVDIEELEKARTALVKEINQGITDKERKFLLSFKEGEPEWDLLGVEKAKNMPAVKWKLVNLKKMSVSKHQKAVDELKKLLENS